MLTLIYTSFPPHLRIERIVVYNFVNRYSGHKENISVHIEGVLTRLFVDVQFEKNAKNFKKLQGIYFFVP